MRSDEVAALWEENAETWTRLVRAGHDRYRDVLNTPAFLALLPPVTGLVGLDIGCGEGANTRAVAGLGARMTGIDIAPTFVRHAREAEAAAPLGIAYEVADAAALPFADGAFDFATAFMSLMDVPDQQGALAEARRVLRPGGFLQFSILHPCFVPPRHRNVRDEAGRVVALEIGGYFEEIDGDIETWIFSTVPPEERASLSPFRVPRFHRPLSRWVEMVAAAGFTIDAMGEPRATEEEAAAEPVVADTRVAPIFLHVRCRKAG
ncbi:class I SAM-dependent methyltransferase [Salinarimonas ramus]|uniref:Methyltransferase n=1 Tax=Salinarimonas ramus TaxID=690164 RepID=A0A917QCI8_9HYPH|nr:class I SAM-dependent methyltransferase [Salinarimonas ramus]GGK43914.1 methyltransferase [Salinarimonas ramus]